MRAVRKYTDCRWVQLYIERWLTAPAQLEDGSLVARAKGTPQGGVVSPLLANIFLHLAFDNWMRQTYPAVPFERYADDVIVHCQSEEQAQAVKRAIAARLARCKLELHPDKTKIVYCKDGKRRGSYSNEKFDFLGYTFRARRSKNRWGQYFVNFSPAVSTKAATKIRHEMKRWRLHLRSDKALDDLARMWNPALRGWINYYGKFYKSALHPVFRQFNHSLTRWAMRKFKRLRAIRAGRSTGLAGWRDGSPGCLRRGTS
jgi:RNA-directed DNA polymerase